MKRFAGSSPGDRQSPARGRGGYTIIELLMATTLTLMLMFVVVTIFASVSAGINDTRATLEMAGRLRAAKARLQLDFDGLTVPVYPPVRPEAGKGYLEIIEGPLGPVSPPIPLPVNFDTGLVDSTVADFDDILMSTTRSRSGPFVGRYRDVTIQSNEAEVAWFVRGRTLYRRVLLIAPQVMPDLDDNHNGSANPTDNNGVVDLVDTGGQSFYALYDISARPQYDASGTVAGWVPNTLGDLTKRENRYAHAVHPAEVSPPAPLLDYPYPVGRWGQLGLPTLRECASPNWMTWANPGAMPAVTPAVQVDLWANPAHRWPEVEPVTGTLLNFQGVGVDDRIGEDVILTNVIGFDIKVWDPGAPLLDYQGAILAPGDPGYLVAIAAGVLTPAGYGAYVDLGYAPAYVPSATAPRPHFNGLGSMPLVLPRVYDTWSFHYEHDGLDQDGNGLIDEGTDGFDNDGAGVVDDVAEMESVPPYLDPLRGIQIKIRTFEPDSRQVREVTVVADFLPK